MSNLSLAHNTRYPILRIATFEAVNNTACLLQSVRKQCQDVPNEPGKPPFSLSDIPEGTLDSKGHGLRSSCLCCGDKRRKGSTYTVTYTCIPSLPSCQNLIWICKHRCLVWFMSKQQEVAHTQICQNRTNNWNAPVPPAFLHSAFAIGGHCDGFADSTHWLFPSLFRSTLPNTLSSSRTRKTNGKWIQAF